MKVIIVFGLIIFVLIVSLVVLVPFFFGLRFESAGRPDENGVFVSFDSGLTWEARNTIRDSRSTLASFYISDFVIDPRNSDRLYVGTRGGGILASEDGGLTWRRISDPNGALEAGAEILRIAVSKNHPETWYVAAYQKNRGVLLKSDDGGKSFREVYFVPVERFGVFDVWVHDGTRAVYVATGQGGFLESFDEGRSWRVLKWFPDGLVRLAVDELTRDFYVLTSRGRMYKSADRGRSWTELTDGFGSFDRSHRNQNLTVGQKVGELYLGSDYGLVRSRDGGVSWAGVPIIIPPEALPVLAVAVNPGNTQSFFISAQSQVYKTSDGGTTWAIVQTPAGGRVTKIVVAEDDPSRMFLISNR